MFIDPNSLEARFKGGTAENGAVARGIHAPVYLSDLVSVAPALLHLFSHTILARVCAIHDFQFPVLRQLVILESADPAEELGFADVLAHEHEAD